MSAVQLLSREAVTQRILHNKVSLQRGWKPLAAQLGKSVEWTVTACLGHMQLSEAEATIVRVYFELTEEEQKWLQTVPYRSANQSATTPSSDPLLYRFYEVTSKFIPLWSKIINWYFKIDKLIDAQCFWTSHEGSHPR